MSTAATLVDDIKKIVGVHAVLTTPADTAPYLTDWRRSYTGTALAVVRPANTNEVAEVVKRCVATNTPIVPQGGNTSMVGGSVPDATGRAIVLSLNRMNHIRSIDTDNDTAIVEAGVILQNVQAAAGQAGRLFPLSLAAEGSCTIGGNLSTNAGGTNVLRYGNTRDLVLGLEVVTPNGEIWHGLSGLRKDNTGYDLKHWFIGAEGTLGIITAAVLKLFPIPQKRAVALVAVESPAHALKLLNRMKYAFADRLVGLELMARVCVDLVLRHIPNTREPFTEHHAWQVLIELNDSRADAPLGDWLEAELGAAFESGEATDAVIAASEAQINALWQLREEISEAQRLEGKNVKHDISIPISRIPAFIEKCDAALMNTFPNISLVCFGHLGDGNLHYNCGLPSQGLANAEAINQIVYDHVDQFGGSISAEHGIGQLKRIELTHHKSPVAIAMMRQLKQALDPYNLMNPGKVV
ncbi:MAG: FAD-binding oxidoreductase [Betaproteobacteria bacterium]|jgi:FAD/FMN-containing dehydrogenase